MAELTQRKCPRCGARLTVERADHHLSGQEKLICPQHGIIGHLGDERGRVYNRHRDDPDEDDD